MNAWKPAALVSTAVAVLSIGYNVALAAPGPHATDVAVAQPHMEAALAALQHAQSELQSAEHNKGGWRELALQGVEKAITQTQKGIAAGNK